MRTRNYFTIGAILLLFCTTGEAQRRGLLSNLAIYNNGVRYNAYNYDSDRYYERDYQSAYERYYHRMSRSDRRCFDDLLHKLDRRTRKAWEDGRLSRWDRERIRSVHYDLDDLLDKYSYDRRRSDRNRNERRYNNSRSYRPGCR